MSEAVTDPRKVEVKIFAEDLLIWLDGQDALNQALRMGIKKLLANGAMKGKESVPLTKGSTELPYRIDLIPWQDKTNENGPFQLCDVETNADLVALRTFVLQHAGGGITTKDNQDVSWYVWVFSDSKTVGRRKSQFVKRRF